MVTAQEIKKDLPGWPDGVINGWLLGLANRPDTGWPPPDDVAAHAWGPILGWRPLSWWNGVTWKLEKRDLSYESLCKATQSAVTGIAKDIEDGNNRDNCTARVNRAVEQLVKSGEFLESPVVMKLSDGLSVIDGNHRVTALLSSQALAEAFARRGHKVPSTTQNAWVGQHSNGEVPLDYPEGL